MMAAGRFRAAVVASAVVAACVLVVPGPASGAWAGEAGAVRTPQRPLERARGVPSPLETLDRELVGTMLAFARRLDGLGEVAGHEPSWGATLSTVNGNRGPAILSDATWQQTLDMLTAFQQLGVTVVKIDITYPLLTPAFHQWIHSIFPSYTTTAQDYRDRYRDVVGAIHARGMRVLVEHSTLFRGGFSALDPSGYYASIAALGPLEARQRYGTERALEAVEIAGEVRPDRLTLLDEPDTQNANFGQVEGQLLYTPEQWVSLVQGEARLIQASIEEPPALGAGSGSWDTETYVIDFAAMPELDSVDLHIYPIVTPGGSLLDRVLRWTQDIHSVAPAKKITIGEAWLYKASAAEVAGGIDPAQVYARDVYSFWGPLDQLFLRLLARLARQEGYEVVCPFWTPYLFAYLRWGDPALEGLTDLQLLGAANDQAMVNMGEGTLTSTGRTWRRIAAGQ